MCVILIIDAGFTPDTRDAPNMPLSSSDQFGKNNKPFSDATTERISSGDQTTERLKGGTQVTGEPLNPQPRSYTPPAKVLADRYELFEQIGTGGMAVLYKAEDTLLRRRVAIKLLDRNVLDEVSIHRFESEAKAASSLNHPNLVSVFDYGQENGRPYLVMDFLEGLSLQAIVRKKGRLKPELAAEMLIQMCEGLAKAHEAGVIHRDIKPGNIMVTPEGRIKIVDFGIAKILNEQIAGGGITKSGEVFGSPAYMSPEQCKGKHIDFSTDIYSLGCTLFEMLMGDPPFVGSDTFSILMQHQDAAPPTLKEASLGEEFSPKLEEVIAKTLAKNPEQRFQSAYLLAEALQDYLDTAPPVDWSEISGLIGVSEAESKSFAATTRRKIVENTRSHEDSTKTTEIFKGIEPMKAASSIPVSQTAERPGVRPVKSPFITWIALAAVALICAIIAILFYLSKPAP